MPQLIDSNLITKAMRRHSGVQLRPLEGLVYRKSYPKLVNKVQLLRDLRTSYFIIFSREDDKSIIEHINQFIAEHAEAS